MKAGGRAGSSIERQRGNGDIGIGIKGEVENWQSKFVSVPFKACGMSSTFIC